MDDYISNIVLNSNLYPLKNETISGKKKPYYDSSFIRQIFDAVKIKKIYSLLLNPNILTEKQKLIKEKSAVCIYSKSATSQYFVFSSNYVDTCRCLIKECPRLFSKCRPNQEEQVDAEIKSYQNMQIAPMIDTSEFYPIQDNFERIIERYSEYKAYNILSNTDTLKYRHFEKITFVENDNNDFENITKYNDLLENPKLEEYIYSSKEEEEHFHYGNWVNDNSGIIRGREFGSNIQKNETYIELSENTPEKENPMFKYQREHNNNKNNVFFQNLK